MRNNVAIKMLCFIFTIVFLVSVFDFYIAEAAVTKNCNYWTFTSENDIGTGQKNRILNVNTYFNNRNVTDDSYANISIKYAINPGNIEIAPKKYYTVDLIELWNGSTREGTVKGNNYPNVTINSYNSKTLKIYISNKQNNYYTLNNINSAESGNNVLRVNTYLDGTDASSLVYQEHYIVGNISNLTVNQNENYVIDSIKFDGSDIENGNNSITVGNNSTKELNIYIKTKPIMLTENSYNSLYITRQSSGDRYFTVVTYLNGANYANMIDYKEFNVDENGLGFVTVEPKEGYEINHINYKGYSFVNGSIISSLSNWSSNTLEIYMQTPQTNIAENDYIIAETEEYHDVYGYDTLTIETYVDGISSGNKVPQDIIRTYKSINGTRTVTITAKDGYSFHHVNANGEDYYTNSVNVDFRYYYSRTIKVYLQSTPANTTENDYIKIVTGNDKDYYATTYSGRNLKVNTYLDGTRSGNLVDSKIITYNSSGPGTITITAKEGYKINYLNYNDKTYSNVSQVTFNYVNGKSDINIYLETLKYLTVNYYYDGEIDSTKTYHAEHSQGEIINIPSNKVDNLVFQKAIISNDDTERSIELDTKDVTLTMPNKSVTVEIFHVTEGDVLLSKKAIPVPGTINNFNIEIKAEGTPFVSTKSADIVLVFDKSGSMGYPLGNKTRMAVLKEAADKFIDSVMPAGSISLNRIAIVAYSGDNPRIDTAYNDAYLLQEFTSSNTIAKNSYKGNNLTAEGGTNNEAGFRKAREVMENARDDVERYVIYMTDGEPTFYYNNNGMTVGPGNDYSETAKNNAIVEALKLKNQSVKIYTVALSPDDTTRIQQVLNPQGDNKYQKNYYHATNANQLTAIYSLLATEINDEIASNAVITDTLPEGFTFNVDSLVSNDDNVTINNGILTWNLDKINVGEKKINFNVEYTGNNYGIMYTNDECTINYNHVNTPNTVTTKVFEKPLEALVPVISTNYYEVGKDSVLIIDPKIYLNKINQGLDEGYVVTDIKIIYDTQPAHGTIVTSEDGTLTYKPNSGYTGKDEFTYTVSMTIVNDEGDPFEIVGTYTNDVNVTINVLNKYELRVNYLYGDTSINTSKILYRYANDNINESALDISGYRFVETQHIGINYAVISGKNITGKMSSNNASITFKYEKNDYSYKIEYYYDGIRDDTKTYIGSATEGAKINSYEEKGKEGYTFINDSGPITISKDENLNIIKVYYIKIKNDLELHTMYNKNKLEPLNNLNIFKDFEYTFGFKFKSGQNGSMTIQLETDLHKLDIGEFALYDTDKAKIGEGIREISRTSNIISLETTSLKYGKEYIVIYNIKGKERSTNIPIKLLNTYLIDNGKNPINIRVTQPGLK